jgi:hypothetical protein
MCTMSAKVAIPNAVTLRFMQQVCIDFKNIPLSILKTFDEKIITPHFICVLCTKRFC